MDGKKLKSISAVVSAVLMLVVGCELMFSVNIELWDGLASEPFSQAVVLAGIETIRVTTRNGDISVGIDETLSQAVVGGTKTAAGEDDDEAEDRLSEVKINMEVSASDSTVLVIDVTWPDDTPHTGDAVDFAIALPSGMNLALRSTNGSVDVQGNAGTVAIETTNGPVEVKGNTGSVSARSTNGQVELADVQGTVEGRTENGQLTLTDIAGNVTGETTNGKITAKIAPPANGAVEVTSVNGRITLAVPWATAASLALENTFGQIDTELTEFVLTNFSSSAHQVTATLNGGGGTITATTLVGRITFAGY